MKGIIPDDGLDDIRVQREEADRLDADIKTKTTLMVATCNQARRETTDEFGWRRTRTLDTSLGIRKRCSITWPGTEPNWKT